MFGARHVLRDVAPQPAGKNFSAAERHARFTQTILSPNQLDSELKLLPPQPRSPCALLTGGGHRKVRPFAPTAPAPRRETATPFPQVVGALPPQRPVRPQRSTTPAFFGPAREPAFWLRLTTVRALGGRRTFGATPSLRHQAILAILHLAK